MKRILLALALIELAGAVMAVDAPVLPNTQAPTGAEV